MDNGKSGNAIPNGAKRTIKGKPCVHYDGYWIRRYDHSADTLSDKKRTIDILTRRVFHHVEPGINTPGHRLEAIRAVYKDEDEPARKRVKGAMLAGALLNRGRDILTHVVELQECGVTIDSANELLVMCGACFTEALELGKNIKLASGEEGLAELWGEPFRVFSLPAEDFYRNRYIKLAQTMQQIDKLGNAMRRIVRETPPLKPARALLDTLCEAAKGACETLRNDPAIFDVWPEFIASKEAFESFQPCFPESNPGHPADRCHCGLDLLREGGKLLAQLAVVRVNMPVSVKNFMERSESFFMRK